MMACFLALGACDFGKDVPAANDSEGETEGDAPPRGSDGDDDDDAAPGDDDDDAAPDDGEPGDDDDDAADTGDPPGDASDCCSAHAGGSCEDADVALCVCDLDAACCVFEWDEACAELAVNECEAPCNGGGDTGAGDDAGMDTGGSTDGGVDPGGSSGGGGGGGDACCTPTQGPGCSDAMVEGCVCGNDPFCCDQSWDDLCVQGAIQCGAGCDAGGTGCCDPHYSAGCDDAAVQGCVCAFDDYCCSQAWDDLCVSEAQQQCMAAC